MIAVLGAGISGLSLAYYLQQQGKEVLLLEKEKTVGGKIKSFSENGFTAELGPNTVLLNNQHIIDLIQDVGLYDQLIFADPENISKRFILFNCKPEAVPNGLLSAFQSPLLSFSTLKNIAAEFKRKDKNQDSESLASLVKRHFGKEAYDNILVPMLTGIYAGNPEKMDADFVLPFLKKAEKEHGSIIRGILKQKKNNEQKNSPNHKIFTFKNGLQELPKAIGRQLDKNLILSAEVSSINQAKNSYRIQYEKEGATKVLEADQVVSTLPTSILSKSKSNFLNEIFPFLLDVPYVPIVVLHYAYPKKNIGFNKKAFGLLSRPSEKVPFLGVLFNSRFFPHTSPKDMDLITVICGGGFNPEITERNNEEIIEEVESSLKNILGISNQAIFKKIYRWKNAIPQYYLGHGNILEALKNFEAEHRGFYFGGNYLHGISVSDCIKNSKNLSEKIIS